MDAFLKQGVYEQDGFDSIRVRLVGLFKKIEQAGKKDYVASTPYFARQRMAR
jgi:hypothetical protein